MSSYKTGTTSPNISLGVDIDTIGIAATRASKRLTGSADSGVAVAHSENATGDITNSDIGDAMSLSGSTLTVATFINLFGNQEERKAEFDKLSAIYSFSGGDDGAVEFSPPDLKLHNNDYTRVTLIINIDLIP